MTSILDIYFKHNKYFITKHHLDSYNTFIETTISKVINSMNPFVIPKYDKVTGKLKHEIKVTIENPTFSTGTMLPNECRIKNKSYLAEGKANINVEIIDAISNQVTNVTLNDVFLFHLPIMLHSNICPLNKMSSSEIREAGECIYDQGGYFIIDGKEKVIVAQERNVNNKLFVELAKEEEKYTHQAFMRCTSETDSVFPKTLWLYATIKKCIHVKVPHINTSIPLFVLFRALGIESDKNILEYINIAKEQVHLIRPSIVEAGNLGIFGQKSALNYLKTFTDFASVENVIYIFFQDFFPNIKGTFVDKARMLGEVAREIVLVSSGLKRLSDRDNYISKRVGISGFLMGDIFKDFYNNFRVETMKKIDNKYEFSTNLEGSGLIHMINEHNKKEIFNASENFINGLVKSLKGNWGLSGDASKQGIVQDLNRISYMSFISHMRRVNAPMDASIKIRQPHQLETAQYGMMCPCESPDGASVGLLKNMAILCHISSGVPHTVILDALTAAKFKITMFSDVQSLTNNSVKLHINNNWVADVYDPVNIVKYIRLLRRNGLINVLISVSWNILENYINILTESGRCCRPLLIVGKEQSGSTWRDLIIGENQDLVPNEYHSEFINPFNDNNTSFESVINQLEKKSGCIEYVDVEETNTLFIAMDESGVTDDSTHIELHPSTIFSVYSSTIPLPNHNQAPRNIFSGAQGKQAIGVYATNFNNRIDTMSYLLHYPQRPIVSTRYADYLHTNSLPNGENLIVAIMTYTGYNQEDSIIVNQSSVDRGMFNLTYFKSYISEETKDKDCHITFENPNALRLNKDVKLTRYADYSKIDDNGMPILESYIQENDCIVGKCIKNITTTKEGNPDQDIFVTKSESISYASKCEIADKTTSGFIDKVFVSENSNGEKQAKIRLRKVRIPELGDKMACYSSDTEVLTNIGWVFWEQLTKDHKVASLGNESELIYSTPTDIFSYEFDDLDGMYHIKNNSVDLLVTGNHRMYISEDDDCKEFKFILASEMESRRYCFKKCVKNYATEDDIFIIENEDLILLGKVFRYGLIDKSDKIVMGSDCDLIHGKTYIFNNDNLYNVAKQMIKFRCFPKFVWELSTTKAFIFMNAIFGNDKILHKSECRSIELQRLALHAGKSATMRGMITSIDDTEDNEALTIQRKPYSGKVYCCTVPTGIVFVRRSGKSVFCGNSRHGQKGVIGAILPSEMMPFTKDGLVPDIIINPHAFPTRMTIGHLIECILAKAGTKSGFYADGTAFENQDWNAMSSTLNKHGLSHTGDEILYNGVTGEQIQCEVFIGPTYYFRLKHMVSDKINSRHSGGKVAMTRQPTKGRNNGGGLRIGEMETNVLLSYGISAFTKESMMERSDNYNVAISKSTGLIIPNNKKRKIMHEPFTNVCIPYSCKQLIQELETMAIGTSIKTSNQDEDENEHDGFDLEDDDIVVNEE